jgi:hypothetical protein
MVSFSLTRRAVHRAMLGCRPGQAAVVLARLIRLRRSAERSSSFKPPHVPYFSGLLIA